MKKIFTLLTVALVAMAANAQVVFDGSEDTANSFTNANVKVAFSADNWSFKSDAKTSDEIAFNGFWTGTTNPDGNGKAQPTKGSVILLTPAQSGTMTVYVVVNSGKATYVLEDGEQIAFNLNGTDMTCGTKLDAKASCVPATFSVTAGKTYAVFCTGSKMGFYGFNLVSAAGVDKSILSQVIADAQEMQVEALAPYITAALDVYDTPDATQKQVDEAVANLKDAIDVICPKLVESVVANYKDFSSTYTSYNDPAWNMVPGKSTFNVDIYSNDSLVIKNWMNQGKDLCVKYGTDGYVTAVNNPGGSPSYWAYADDTYWFYVCNSSYYAGYSWVSSNSLFLEIAYGSSWYGYYLTWDTTTGINAATVAPAKAGKFIENGKLVIVKNGKKYNAAGALLK